MKVTEIQMTPQKAMNLLSRNDHNRPLSAKYVAAIVEVMKRGEWRHNGETIKVGKSGDLLDGQHRLQAVVNSGKTVKMLLAEHVEDDVFATIDLGKRRTASDALAIKGTVEYACKAAAIRLILILSEPNVNFRMQITPQQIVDWVGAFGDDLEKFMKVGRDVAKTQMLDRSIVVGLSWFMEQKSKSTMDSFWERMIDGAGLAKGHPVLALRKRLTDNRIATAKLSREHIVAITIKAWNKTRKGETLGPRAGLLWREDEQFPKFV